MDKLFLRYKQRQDLYHFMALITLMLLGFIVIAVYFFDLLLLAFYLLYVSEILVMYYIIKKQDDIFRDRDEDILIKEKNALIIMSFLLSGLIILLGMSPLTNVIVFVVVLFLVITMIQLYLTWKHLKIIV